jgi:hypothetical protein
MFHPMERPDRVEPLFVAVVAALITVLLLGPV